MADKAQCLRVLGELNTLKMIGALEKEEFTDRFFTYKSGGLFLLFSVFHKFFCAFYWHWHYFTIPPGGVTKIERVLCSKFQLTFVAAISTILSIHYDYHRVRIAKF